VFSIDEAFVDITHHLPADEARYTNRARQIQATIMERLGISVSVGVAPTRLLAKMFAGMNKPFGVTI
jgi:nucleotidyltransferase/DNA polymerase involved in DNA repair